MTSDCREMVRLDLRKVRHRATERVLRLPLAALLALGAAAILLVGTPPAGLSPAAHRYDAPVRVTPAADSAPEATRPLDPLDDPGIAAALAPPAASDWSHRNHPAAAPSADKAPGGTETLANWSASLGPGSGHLAITGTGLDSRSAALNFNAGAGYAPGPMHFDLGLTGSQSGSWSALASGRLDAGKLSFTATRRENGTLDAGLAAGQSGASVAADSALGAGLSLHGALNWSRSDGNARDTRGYQGSVALSHDFGNELKLVGSASVSGSGADTWLAAPLVTGAAGVQWTPGGGPALSAAISDQIGGSYRLSMAAARPFN